MFLRRGSLHFTAVERHIKHIKDRKYKYYFLFFEKHTFCTCLCGSGSMHETIYIYICVYIYIYTYIYVYQMFSFFVSYFFFFIKILIRSNLRKWISRERNIHHVSIWHYKRIFESNIQNLVKYLRWSFFREQLMAFSC